MYIQSTVERCFLKYLIDVSSLIMLPFLPNHSQDTKIHNHWSQNNNQNPKTRITITITHKSIKISYTNQDKLNIKWKWLWKAADGWKLRLLTSNVCLCWLKFQCLTQHNIQPIEKIFKKKNLLANFDLQMPLTITPEHYLPLHSRFH